MDAAPGTAFTVDPEVRRAPGDVVRAVAVVVAVAWVALLVHGGVEHLGRFAARPVAAAASCGVALLVAATKPVERHASDVGALVALWMAVTLGLVGGVGDASVIPLALGVAAGAVVVAFTAERSLPATLVTAGAALVVGGFAIAGEAAARFDATAFAESPSAVALALTGAAVVLVGALDSDGPSVLAVPALATAAVIAPHAGTAAAVVIPVGLAAGAAAWFDRRPLAVALTAVAALAVTSPCGLLLGAAAVVVLAVPSSPALAAAAPGAVALAVHATQQPSVAAVGATAAAALVGILLTVGRDLRPTTIPLRSAPAAAAGVHLALAPGTWGWTGATPDLAHWDRGAAIALAAGLLAVVFAVQTGTAPLPRRDPHEPASDAEPPATDPTWAARTRTVAIAALGLALAALVRSSLRSVQ